MNRLEKHRINRVFKDTGSMTDDDRKWIAAVIRRRRETAREDELYSPVDPLARRASFVAHVRSVERGGMVGVRDTGMDCDCSRWERHYNRPAVPRQLEAMMERGYEEAEGPQAFCIIPPVEEEACTSRDLALEAYENGHPHVVYT